MTVAAGIESTTGGQMLPTQSQGSGPSSHAAWAGAVAASLISSSSSATGDWQSMLNALNTGTNGLHGDVNSTSNTNTSSSLSNAANDVSSTPADAVLGATLPSTLPEESVSGRGSATAADDSNIGISAAKTTQDLKVQTLDDSTESSASVRTTNSTKKSRQDATESTTDQSTVATAQAPIAPEAAVQSAAMQVQATSTEQALSESSVGSTDASHSEISVPAALAAGEGAQSSTGLLLSNSTTDSLKSEGNPSLSVKDSLPTAAASTGTGSEAIDKKVSQLSIGTEDAENVDALELSGQATASTDGNSSDSKLNGSLTAKDASSATSGSMARSSLAGSNTHRLPGQNTASATTETGGSTSSLLSSKTHSQTVNASPATNSKTDESLVQTQAKVAGTDPASSATSDSSNALNTSIDGAVPSIGGVQAQNSSSSSSAVSRVSSGSTDRSVKQGAAKSSSTVASTDDAQYSSRMTDIHSATTSVDASALGHQLGNSRETMTHAGSGNDKPGSTLADTFAAIDSGSSSVTPTWVHNGAQSAEAGYLDPVLGWVSVKADATISGVHAVVVPGSSDAAQALGAQMDGLNAYVAEHHSAVSSVTISTTEDQSSLFNMSQGSGQSMQQGTGQGAGQDTRQNSALYQQSSTPTYQSDTTSTNSTLQTGTTDGAAQTRSGGVYISLIA